MRTSLLASAALLGIALAFPAAAQTTGAGPTADAGTPPAQFLQAAQQAVQKHRAAAAQEALERAETRLLDRSTAPSRADQPDSAPAVQEISQAIAAIGKHDWSGAGQHIDAALHAAQAAQTAQSFPPQPAPMPMQTAMPTAMKTNAAGSGGMTTGESTVPMGNVMPPNGGVMPPNGGVMPPSTE